MSKVSSAEGDVCAHARIHFRVVVYDYHILTKLPISIPWPPVNLELGRKV